MADQDAPTPSSPPTVLCLASYEKGAAFLRQAKREGCRVLLLTASALEGAPWPREAIDELVHMPDLADAPQVILGVSYLARRVHIDRIVPLDDYDVETAAALREHLRLPGSDSSTARLVRDKLAMRVVARAQGIVEPDFAPVFNDDEVAAYVARVPPPWVLKPRGEVSTIGITRFNAADELWSRLDELGNLRSFHLLERYVPGTVYHVDSLVSEGRIVFCETSQYGRPPLDVYHEGGISTTRLVARGSDDDAALRAVNQAAIKVLRVVRGAVHLECIKGHDDGRFYFLEAANRVGGASIADAVEAATGVNLWAEWARMEAAQIPSLRDARGKRQGYKAPKQRRDYAGVIVSLARQEYPDTAAYDDPEIVMRMEKRHHVGFVVASPDLARVETLLAEYARRFADDFSAALPPQMGRPSHD